MRMVNETDVKSMDIALIPMQLFATDSERSNIATVLGCTRNFGTKFATKIHGFLSPENEVQFKHRDR